MPARDPILGQVGSVLRQALLLLEMARTTLADGPRAVNQRPEHSSKMLLESAVVFFWSEGLGEGEKAEVDRARQSVGFDLWGARFSNPGSFGVRGTTPHSSHYEDIRTTDRPFC